MWPRLQVVRSPDTTSTVTFTAVDVFETVDVNASRDIQPTSASLLLVESLLLELLEKNSSPKMKFIISANPMPIESRMRFHSRQKRIPELHSEKHCRRILHKN